MMNANLMMSVVFVRLIIGLAITVGAAIILATSYINQESALIGAGIVFIFSGINLILFKTVLRTLVTKF